MYGEEEDVFDLDTELADYFTYNLDMNDNISQYSIDMDMNVNNDMVPIPVNTTECFTNKKSVLDLVFHEEGERRMYINTLLMHCDPINKVLERIGREIRNKHYHLYYKQTVNELMDIWKLKSISLNPIAGRINTASHVNPRYVYWFYECNAVYVFTTQEHYHLTYPNMHSCICYMTFAAAAAAEEF